MGGVKHEFPQLPQLFGSLSRFAHAPPHMEPCEPGQAQTPSRHTRPGAQLFPQWPHWNASLERSTHPPPHSVCAAAHASRHAPAAQTWLVMQATVQLPQWLRSALRSVQAPLHTAPPHDWVADGPAASSDVPTAEASEPEASPDDDGCSSPGNVRPQAEQTSTHNRKAELNKRKVTSPTSVLREESSRIQRGGACDFDRGSLLPPAPFSYDPTQRTLAEGGRCARSP
jgi:hypothetical protein